METVGPDSKVKETNKGSGHGKRKMKGLQDISNNYHGKESKKKKKTRTISG